MVHITLVDCVFFDFLFFFCLVNFLAAAVEPAVHTTK